MEKHWTYVCQILTLISLPLFGFCGKTTSTVDKNPRAFFHRYYDCIPVLLHNGSVINSTRLPNGHHLEEVTLKFVAFGRQLQVDLSLNRHLFPASYVVRVVNINKTGAESNSTTRPVPENCFYHGIVHGQPLSEVAISTCGGEFSGYITERRDSYHIQPLKGRIHRVYRNSDQKQLPFKCGTVGHDNRLHNHRDVIKRYKRSAPIKKKNPYVSPRGHRGIYAPYDSNSNTRYVELYLVNDYRTYERYGKVMDVVIKRSQDIANVVSGLYRQLNIYVALVGVEVWSAGDLITISKSADNTMENFLRYRKERINPYHRNDNSQLITGKMFDHGVVGKAIKGPICTHQFSGGVNMDYGSSVTLVATTVAHEMGHNFGMEHDNDTMCQCRDQKCIMAATSGQISPHYWSSCSQNALAEAFDLGMDYCLQNLPEQIYFGPVCGNGFKEDWEECDCGLPDECTNRCCDPHTCRMYSSAQCATGMCCDFDECKPKRAATMCRKPEGECDVPEYCDGVSEYCPQDYYLQDGHVCQQGESYCYNGKCNTHTNQCKLLWGETGRVSDPICFQQLNTNGNEEGACSYNWTTGRYSRCDKEDVMCGLLHCVHLNEKLMFWKDNLALSMGASFLSRGKVLYVCRSAMLDVGLDMKDPGLVPDGSKCEDNKICINQKCVSLSKLDITECPDDCNGNGKCNSNNTCHCDIGYAPPMCDGPGYGGSIYSGPASRDFVIPGRTDGGGATSKTPGTGTTTNKTSDYESDSSSGGRVRKDLLVILLVVLVVLIFLVLAILVYCNRGRLRQWLDAKPDIQYRVKGKSEKAKPPSLLDSTSSGMSRSDSSNSSSGNPPPYTPNPTAPLCNNHHHHQQPQPHPEKVPPKRPALAPKRFLSGKKLNPEKSNNYKEQFSNHNANFTSSQPDIGVNSSPASSCTNIPNSPKSSAKAIIKRESIRGSKISGPVLMSTTNRDSVVLADMQVSIIGPEAERESSTDSPRQLHKAATTSPVKRSYSDRQASRPDLLMQLPHLEGSGNLQKSESLKDTSPVAEVEKELIYANEMDMGGLLNDIDQELRGDKNVYYNVSDSNPFQSAVLEINDTSFTPSDNSQLSDTSGNAAVSTNKSTVHNPATLVLSNTNTANKITDLSSKEKPVNSSSDKPAVHSNKKTASSNSLTNPIEELKKSLQSKNQSSSSPKNNTTNNSPSKTRIAGKTTSRNSVASTSSNANTPKPTAASRTGHNVRKEISGSDSKNESDGPKTQRGQLSRTNSGNSDGSNIKPNVSNLAARFNQTTDASEKKPSISASKPGLKRNQTISGASSGVTTTKDNNKPEVSAKPLPPPKPGNTGERTPSAKPASGIKRVHSYRI